MDATSAYPIPHMRVSSLEKRDRADGFDDMLAVLYEPDNGPATLTRAEIALTDHPWGTEWLASLQYEGKQPIMTDLTPVEVRSRVTYGEIRGDQRADTIELVTTYASGKRKTQITEGELRPARRRPRLSGDVYRDRLSRFLAGEPYDESGASSAEDPFGLVGALSMMLSIMDPLLASAPED